jgi:hypothetical protein
VAPNPLFRSGNVSFARKIELSEDAEVVKAVEGLLRTDSTAIALMAMDFPDERSVSNLTMERQLHFNLL